MSDSRLVRELSLPLYAGKGWLTLLGILSLLSGIVTALSVVGLLVAWVPIWAGITLIQAGKALQHAHERGDADAMRRALAKLKTYFVILGVIALIGILPAFLVAAVTFNAAIHAAITGLG